MGESESKKKPGYKQLVVLLLLLLLYKKASKQAVLSVLVGARALHGSVPAVDDTQLGTFP